MTRPLEQEGSGVGADAPAAGPHPAPGLDEVSGWRRVLAGVADGGGPIGVPAAT